MADSSSRALAVAPTFPWMRQRLSRLIAFGFGAGLLKPAPGTWGTLFAWLTWPLVAWLDSPGLIAMFLIGAFALGAWACDRVGAELGVQDYGGLVWDEIVAFWLVLWLIPDSVLAQAFGFLLFRLFDIIKPAPIRQVDRRFKHGLGVMLDDLLAAFYAVLVFAILHWLFA